MWTRNINIFPPSNFYSILFYFRKWKKKKNYHNHVCIRRSIFSRLFSPKVKVHIIQENYMIIYSDYLPRHMRDECPKISYIYCPSKYVLRCYREISTGMWIYNFVFPNVSLFSLQACCILVWLCLYVFSKYSANFVFLNKEETISVLIFSL